MTTLETRTNGPLLELRDVAKRFGRVRALQEVSLQIDSNDVVGLIGDNGAGKSTLIKVLSGVHRPDSGQILFESTSVRFRSPQDARAAGIETLYQDLALVEDLSVARNFFLGKEPLRGFGPLRWLDFDHMNRMCTKALDELGIVIPGGAQAHVRNLSGGQRQAVAIARAIHFGAKLLILDEPTAALSVRQTEKVLDNVRLAKRRGLAVILITHNMHHVYPVSDRIVVLELGKKIADRSTSEVTLDELSEIVAGRGPAERPESNA